MRRQHVAPRFGVGLTCIPVTTAVNTAVNTAAADSRGLKYQLPAAPRRPSLSATAPTLKRGATREARSTSRIVRGRSSHKIATWVSSYWF